MPDLALVYTTVSSEKDASRLAEKLIRSRIAACANIHAIKSVYWWKGKLVKDKEFAVLFKTTKKKAEELKKEIKEIHPYELPCIIEFGGKASKEFEKYIMSETKHGKK